MIALTLLAQITNKALPGSLQDASSPAAAGAGLGKYIGVLWQTALVMGGIAVVAYMIMGGLTWIMAGGDKGKVEQAKERITQSLIGLAVLFSVAAISVFFSSAFGLDLLAPNFNSITNTGGGAGSFGGGGGSGTSTETICSLKEESPYNNADGEYGCDGKPVVMKCSDDRKRWVFLRCK